PRARLFLAPSSLVPSLLLLPPPPPTLFPYTTLFRSAAHRLILDNPAFGVDFRAASLRRCRCRIGDGSGLQLRLTDIRRRGRRLLCRCGGLHTRRFGLSSCCRAGRRICRTRRRRRLPRRRRLGASTGLSRSGRRSTALRRLRSRTLRRG